MAKSARMLPNASTTWKRILVALLALWGAGLIVPEFARVLSNYGSLGFEADNDGKITSVGGPPATDRTVNLHPGDCIDLHRTDLDNRLAVFGSLGGMTYVRPDQEVTLYVAGGSCNDVAARSSKRVLKANNAWMTPANRIMLVADQISGLFFIGVAAALVWQRPSAMTWGFFFYAIWFNPGQWFVSYAQLQRHWYWLIPQQVLQAVAQAIGYAGFVTFALRFPHNRVEPRWRPVEKMLPALVLALIALQLLSFGTILGFQTEAVSRWYYWTGYGIDIAVLFILRFRRKAQAPEDQQRTRWVHWGCRAGLFAFIFADSNMATGAWTPLWDNVCPSPIGALMCSNGGPSETFLLAIFLLNGSLALAVFHAVRHHRVIDVRFALSRGATLLLTSFIIAALLTGVSMLIEHLLHESLASPIFIYLLVVASVKLSFDKLHEWLKERCDYLFFKRLHTAEKRLKHAAENLRTASNRDAIDAQLITEAVAALDLASAAIFRLDADGRYHRAPHAIAWPPGLAMTIPFGESLLHKLASTQQPVQLRSRDMHESMPKGSAQPVIAVPVLAGNALDTIVIYGAHTTGDKLSDEEVQLLAILDASAASAYDRVDALALRNKIHELQAKTSSVGFDA